MFLFRLNLTWLFLVSLTASAETRYVNLNNPSSAAPYTSWLTAATNIQDAIDVAMDGDMVLVTNGVYRTGGRAVFGTMTNRIALTKAITVESVNGPNHTFIEGSGFVANAVRCAYLTNQAQLIGFTLTNGATLGIGDSAKERSGGGVWCESPSSLVSNCVIIANFAYAVGGGGYGGGYWNCNIKSNSAGFGGGVAICWIWQSIISGNTASTGGGGTYSVSEGRNNTIVGNYCSAFSGAGGTFGGVFYDCIIYYNSNPSGSLNQNYFGLNGNNNCTTPNAGSLLNNPPLFLDLAGGDYRLQPYSPCINAGSKGAAFTTIDLSGNPRVVGGTLDVGAYEFQSPTSLLSYAWAHRYGIITDGSADFDDEDGDGASNWHEFRADTIPTNAVSNFRVVSITNGTAGISLTWPSIFQGLYWVERGTNLQDLSSFQTIATNLVGGFSTKTYIDATATNGGSYFYRVGVQ